MRTKRKFSDIGNPSLNEGESSNLDHEETNRSLEETQQCNPRAVEDAPDIFLSHSGCQKPFVEFLYKALQGANYTVFFDQDVLPKGQPFPDNIKQAAAGCKVGVVVLSEEFLTSLWPMVELKILVSRRVPSPYVLPLFYELKPEDLKSEEKLEKWRDVWKKLARNENDAKQWEQALQGLRRFNGDVYPQGTSTYDYIDKMVKHISTLIPCHVPYDCSSIQGQSRLVQEIETKFELLDASRARFVGLHGVGGLGKTTLCQVMVNYYNRHYLGRSFLIEFPSHGGDKSRITSECKKALRVLTDASEKHLLKKVDSFDQVVQLMKDRVGRQDVFLAIDNLWEFSRDEAKKVLQAGFNAKSKILVTSRSEGLLKDLLMVTYKSPGSKACVAPLPAPKCEEAFQIFQESFELRDLRVLVDINEMNNVLNRCRFNGSYHALALKTLAKYVRRVCEGMDLEKVEDHLSGVLKEISAEKLEEVEDVIRLNYDHLSEEKKHLFLDIVVLIHHLDRGWGKNMYAAVEEELSFHWKLTKLKTSMLVDELSLDGLIQIEVAKFVGKRIELHDLYSELAWREIAISPRYLLQVGIKISVLEKVEWENLETVIIRDDKSLLFEKLQQRKCPKLKRLIVEKTTILKGRGVRLADSMPSLTVLELGNEGECATLDSEDEDGSAALDSENKKMLQSDMLQPLKQVTGMPSLEHKGFVKGPDQKGLVKSPRGGFVRGEGLVDASSNLHLSGLVELRMLKVENYGFVGIAGLSTLVQLRVLHIKRCRKLQKLPDLSSLTCLERLLLSDNAALEEVGGLSCTLKDVSVGGCSALKRMPDMSSLTCLERLQLDGNAALEEVGGLSCTLKDVSVDGCRALKRMPDMSSLTCLERLQLSNNAVLEEVGGLSCTLEDVSVGECSALKRVLDMSSLTCLERLHLYGIAALEEVGGLSCTLKDVSVGECSALKRMPDMSSLTCLERLQLSYNAVLEEVGGLSCTLEVVSVGGCSALKRVPDMRSLTCLERLQLSNNAALEEVGGLSCTLKDVSVGGCSALKRMPDMSSLTCLERLQLFDNVVLEEVGGLSCTLEDVSIDGCSALKRMPDMSSLTCLERLQLLDNAALEEVGGLSCTLKDVNVDRCSALKRMPDLSSLTSLESLELYDNAALEEVGGLSCTLKDVIVNGCSALKRMPDLSSLTGLERLQLYNNAALEEVGGLSCTLKDVIVGGCSALKRMPDLSSLTGLESLLLYDNAALEEVGGEYLSSTLKRLGIWKCGMLRSCPSVDECMHLKRLEMGWADCLRVLQKIPNLKISLRECCIRDDSSVKEIDVGCFSNLKNVTMWNCEALKKVSVGGSRLRRLSVESCEALEEIRADLEALPSFKQLRLSHCRNLKELGAVSSIRLEWLLLRNCPSLEESSIPEAEIRY